MSAETHRLGARAVRARPQPVDGGKIRRAGQAQCEKPCGGRSEGKKLSMMLNTIDETKDAMGGRSEDFYNSKVRSLRGVGRCAPCAGVQQSRRLTGEPAAPRVP